MHRFNELQPSASVTINCIGEYRKIIGEAFTDVSRLENFDGNSAACNPGVRVIKYCETRERRAASKARRLLRESRAPRGPGVCAWARR